MAGRCSLSSRPTRIRSITASSSTGTRRHGSARRHRADPEALLDRRYCDAASLLEELGDHPPAFLGNVLTPTRLEFAHVVLAERTHNDTPSAIGGRCGATDNSAGGFGPATSCV